MVVLHKKTSNNSQVKFTSNSNRNSGTSNQAKYFNSLYSNNCIIACANRCSVDCNAMNTGQNACCKGGRPNMDNCSNKC